MTKRKYDPGDGPSALLGAYEDNRALAAEIERLRGELADSQKNAALLREWVLTRVPHLEGCPWRGLTRDSEGLLPGCRCGRDALLKATEVPHE